MSSSGAVPLPRAAAGPDWPVLIGEVLRQPHRIDMVFQPIVSLAEATVVGYESLARFDPSPDALPPGTPMPSPDLWFAAADRLGLGAELESLVVRHCLLRRFELPGDCFLTVNVSPHLITDPLVAEPLLAAGPLAPLVLELTEHTAVADLAPLVRLRDEIAGRGGLIALDDAGAGYSGLQQMTRMRPHMIKLDRGLVQDIDGNEMKIALVEMLGEFAGRIDAWLLAAGVETWSELETLLRLHVPLAQGFLLGRPGPPWVRLEPGLADALRVQHRRTSLTEHVARLVERAPVVPAGTARALLQAEIALEVDEHERPTALLTAHPDGVSGPRRRPVSLRVPPSASVVDTARRILARDPRYRFDPVVCVDERGHSVGVIRVERVIHQLLEPHPGRWSDDGYVTARREGDSP